MKADQNWRPSTAHLEAIAEAAAARMPAAWTAARLGVSVATLAAFEKRLAKAREADDATLMEAIAPAKGSTPMTL
jgi:hypothetical protein